METLEEPCHQKKSEAGLTRRGDEKPVAFQTLHTEVASTKVGRGEPSKIH